MSETSPQNSQLRESTKDYFYKTADLIHRNYPSLTANQLTMGRAIASMLATEGIVRSSQSKKKLISVLGYTAFELLDGVDGHLANIRALESDTPTNLRGNLYDTMSDKTVETYNCFKVASRSLNNQDRIGATLNTLAGVTSSLPALFRAKAESNNLVVKENGIGTRPVRATLIGLNLAFGNNKHVSRVIGGSILGMNIHTATKRYFASKNRQSKNVVGYLDNDKKQLEAKLRYPALTIFSLGATAMGYRFLKKTFNKEV
jgi:phosphatidylglycerophosphate synthase